MFELVSCCNMPLRRHVVFRSTAIWASTSSSSGAKSVYLRPDFDSATTSPLLIRSVHRGHIVMRSRSRCVRGLAMKEFGGGGRAGYQSASDSRSALQSPPVSLMPNRVFGSLWTGKA